MDTLKKQLQSVFVDNAPFQISESGRKTIVSILPFLSLFSGVLALWGAWSIYNLMSTADRLIDYTNTISRAYGAPESVVSSFSFFGWLSVAFLVVEAVIAFKAYGALTKKQKSGWDLLFVLALVNVGYAVVTLFSNVSDFGAFLFAISTSIVGLFVLFQVRSIYDPSAPKGKRQVHASAPSAHSQHAAVEETKKSGKTPKTDTEEPETPNKKSK